MSEFDWEYYVATYNLPFRDSQKALEHWEAHGKASGYEARNPYGSDIVDTRYYKGKYEDLSKLSDLELRIHWYQYGIKEGRIPNKNLEGFDWKFYVSFYDDLKNAGIDSYEKALRHWCEYGEREGRIPNKNLEGFDWKFYVSFYDDLKNAGIDSYEKALRHWCEYGEKEGRIFRNYMEDFDWKFYVSFYMDLREAGIDTYEKALDHWNQYGKKEERFGCDKLLEFDWRFYASFYDDIANDETITRRKVIEHWFKYGVLEKRLRKNPDELDWRFYVSLYDDLRNAGIDSHKKAIEHWLRYGKFERRYPKMPEFPGFDINLYINLFPDLSEVSITEARVHLVKYGMKEGRVYLCKRGTVTVFSNLRQDIRPGERYISLRENFNVTFETFEYYYLLPEFVKEYGKFNELQYFMYRYLDYIRQLTLKSEARVNEGEMFFVFDKALPHTEFIIRQAVRVFGHRYKCYIITSQFLKSFFESLIKDLEVEILAVFLINDIEHLRKETGKDIKFCVFGDIIFITDTLIVGNGAVIRNDERIEYSLSENWKELLFNNIILQIHVPDDFTLNNPKTLEEFRKVVLMKYLIRSNFLTVQISRTRPLSLKPDDSRIIVALEGSADSKSFDVLKGNSRLLKFRFPILREAILSDMREFDIELLNKTIISFEADDVNIKNFKVERLTLKKESHSETHSGSLKEVSVDELTRYLSFRIFITNNPCLIELCIAYFTPVIIRHPRFLPDSEEYLRIKEYFNDDYPLCYDQGVSELDIPDYKIEQAYRYMHINRAYGIRDLCTKLHNEIKDMKSADGSLIH
jgi:hypothetical protein